MLLHRFHHSILLSLALSACFVVSSAAERSTADVYADVSRSVVIIVAVGMQSDFIGQGSGVVVNRDVVITNCHVLKGTNEVGVLYQDKFHPAPRVLDSNISRDLCLLSVPGLPAPAIVVGSATTLRVGEEVLAIGAPHGIELGVELTLSKGLISSLRRQPDEAYPIIQTSAPFSPGSSGGALLDNSGRLIGITTAIHRTGQNLNFAVPADWIRDMPAAGLSKYQHLQQRPD